MGAISGKQKDSVQKETLEVSATKAISVDRPLKGNAPWEVVRPERKIKCENAKEIVRIRRVTFGILPNVKTHQKESGCKFGDECLFRHAEADSQPSKKSKHAVGKDRLPN